jgi:hypothetical protein
MSGAASLLPKGRIVRVTFELELPEAAGTEAVRQWLAYELMHAEARMEGPLAGHGIDLISAPRIEDTGMHLVEREDAYPDGKGGTRPERRVWRVPQGGGV